MRTVKRVLALTTSTALLAAGLGVAAPAAFALNSVGAVINPGTGTNLSTLEMVTDGPCATTVPASTNFLVRVFGQGFPADGFNVVGNSGLSTAPRTANGGYRIPLSQLMQTYADLQSPAAVLGGQYRFQFVCKTSLGSTALDDYNAFINFTSTTAFVTPGTASLKVATATTLAATPAAVTQGTDITLTATLTDAASVLDGGSYQFSIGATPLGAPVPAVGGVATKTVDTSALSGPVNIQATFAPTRGNTYLTSSANATSTVTAPKLNTTTSLVVTPAQTATTPLTTDVVALVATVTPATGAAPAAGNVVFRDGTSVLGTVTTTNGSATLSRTFAGGSYSFTAEFVDNAAFGVSTSTAVARTVYVSAVAPAFQDITTIVAAGALTITVGERSVVLPTLALDPAGTLLQSSGSLNPVTITDRRAGNPGWNASGQVSDFVKAGDATLSINGSNLGWSPAIVSKSTAQTIVAGGTVTPALGIAPGAALADRSVGLKSRPRTLATAAPGVGNGTAVVGAVLALNVPTSTTAGTYTALLTFTAI